MKYVTPFNEWREPAPDTEFVTLYRGDDTVRDLWSLDKSSNLNAFLDGIYFTDDPAFAEMFAEDGGVVSAVDVPKEWIDQCLDLTSKPTQPVIDLLIELVRTYTSPKKQKRYVEFLHGTLTDPNQAIGNPLYGLVLAGWDLGSDGYRADYSTGPNRKRLSKSFRDGMQRLGYKGMSWTVTFTRKSGIGSVPDHIDPNSRSYVLWDEQGIAKLRARTKQPGVSK